MLTTVVSQADIDALINSPTPAWLLKHSTACGTSAAALSAYQAFLDKHPDAPAGLLIIQAQRALSNWVATRLNYTHQSPQLFLLKNGAVAWNASHWSITPERMEQAWNKA